MIALEKINGGGYKVLFENRVYLGDILRDFDGFYYFFPDLSPGGYWDEALLISIGTKMKELNEPFRKELEEFFRKEKEKDD